MLCAVGLICGTMFGAASLNHGIVLSADSAAAPLIHRAAQLLTLLVAFFAGLLLKNSFLITLQQRMQMLGRLCALGMPRRQMGWMLLWEALLGMGAAFLVGAPLSALALGGLFRWLNASPVVRERFGLLQLWVPPATVLFCAVCCVAALVSVRKPWQILRAAAPMALLQGRNAPARRPKPPTRWPLGQGFAAAYGRRDLQQRGAMFRPLAVGLAACVVLVMACQAFVGGMALLYDQRTATYAYRVYLHSENGSVPDALWQQLAEAAPEMDTVRVEELNAPAAGGMFRLLILEDAAFAAWYGQGLTLSQDGLPYIRADAVSDGPAQAPPMAGTQPVMVGRQPSPLPLGIGRIPEEDRVTVGVTARSVFDQRVPDPLPGRSLVVYFDAADGRLLTPRLTALLDAANCRYTIQDYTPTSDWARQRQAIGLLLAAIRACFPPGGSAVGRGGDLYRAVRPTAGPPPGVCAAAQPGPAGTDAVRHSLCHRRFLPAGRCAGRPGGRGRGFGPDRPGPGPALGGGVPPGGAGVLRVGLWRRRGLGRFCRAGAAAAHPGQPGTAAGIRWRSR